MRPPYWNPPIELSEAEQSIISRIKRAKLFIFLRYNRHLLFDQQFQAELTTMVLNCHDCQNPPFSKGTLVNFRQGMIDFEVDRRLIERTVEIAKEQGGFGSSNLRGALDSSPLWGAAKVEDTYNLLGHALGKAVRLMAQTSGQSIAELAQETQVDDLVTGTSLKAALDMNWDDPTERSIALETILNALDRVESQLQKKTEHEELKDAQEALSVARQIQSQDVTIDSSGKPTLIKGVAKDRRISIEDSDMRHGRTLYWTGSKV